MKVAGPRSRWITLSVWIVAIAVLTLCFPSVNEEETGSRSLLPDGAMSVEAQRLSSEQFPDAAGTPLLVVWYRDGGLAASDYAAIHKVYAQLEKNPLENQSFVPPLGNLPPQALKQSASEDGEAIVTPVFFQEQASVEQLTTALDSLKQRIGNHTDESVFATGTQTDGLHVRLTGPVGIQTDATALFSTADVTLLISTVLLVLILLIVLYRSPLLAIVPLIGVGMAYGVISPVLGFMASRGWITVDSQAISIMTVLLFGAGTDYCLFLVSRFRDELRHITGKYDALIQAVRGSGGAIIMSALTVVLALLTLMLAHYASYDRFAVPFSLAVFIMGIAALTLLPALLAIFGRASFFPFIPRTEEMIQEREKKKGKRLKRPKETGRVWRSIGNGVTKRPWTVIIASLILLGGLAAFVPKIEYSYGLLDSFPETMPSREGFALLQDHFPAGELAPVKVIVDTEGKNVDIAEKLQPLPFVKAVSEPRTGKTNEALKQYEVTLAMDPYSTPAIAKIPALRSAVQEAAASAGIASPADHVWIGGETATLYDTKQVTSRDQAIIIPVVLVIIAVLLLVYLRSVVAMVYLLATVVLSYLSALGAGWLLIHFGYGQDAMQGLIPLYAFVFLVALGEDYNIFMISSIWKKRREMPLRDAIASGVHETGSVITSAGLILAGTFAVLAVLPLQVLVQFGTVTAIGVLLDTFIVRPLLVPAITAVLGRFAFWPGK
ncbi:MAG TPA: MMPL family transporter [Bacillales bacterium]|nr:MMPL family transporter [Bacillales bacterium]